MDVNKNGCLDAADYTYLELIQKAGKSAPSMSMFDTEKNQCLDFKEYVSLVDYMRLSASNLDKTLKLCSCKGHGRSPDDQRR